MFMFQSLLLSGIAVGFVYCLVALGYNVILNSTRILNLTQGEFLMLGGLLGAVLATHLNMPLVATYALAVICSVVFGILVMRLAITPLINKNAPHASFIIITLAASQLTSEGANVLSGGLMRSVKPILGDTSLRLFGIFFPPQILGIIVVSMVLLLALWFFFNKTMVGMSMNAVAINKEGAQLVGIKHSRVVLLSFVIAAFVGGVAGVMLGQWQHVYPHMGLGVGIKGFAASVVGGIGNWWGALLGGLLIGILEALASGYVSSAYADSVALLVMLFVLWLKPEGLLPSRL